MKYLKLFENVNFENWDEEEELKRSYKDIQSDVKNNRRLRREKELEFIKERCPSAYVVKNFGYYETKCDAHEFLNLLEEDRDNVCFAGNCDAFDDENKLRELIFNLENLGAKNIEIGTINADLHFKDINANAIYFKNLTEEEVHNVFDELNPSELDFIDWDYGDNNVRVDMNFWRVWWD